MIDGAIQTEQAFPTMLPEKGMKRRDDVMSGVGDFSAVLAQYTGNEEKASQKITQQEAENGVNAQQSKLQDARTDVSADNGKKDGAAVSNDGTAQGSPEKVGEGVKKSTPPPTPSVEQAPLFPKLPVVKRAIEGRKSVKAAGLVFRRASTKSGTRKRASESGQAAEKVSREQGKRIPPRGASETSNLKLSEKDSARRLSVRSKSGIDRAPVGGSMSGRDIPPDEMMPFKKTSISTRRGSAAGNRRAQAAQNHVGQLPGPGRERDVLQVFRGRERTQETERGGVSERPVEAFVKHEVSSKSIPIESNHQTLKYADGNFDEIIRQFNLLVRRGGGEARLLLQPEQLGSLKLRIQLDRGEIATSFLVDNQAVKDLIVSRMNILEESLLEHGFHLGSFDVDVKGEGAESSMASREGTGGSKAVPVNPQMKEYEMPLDVSQAQYLPWMSTRVNLTV
jgi:hypothetical protein